MSRNGSVVESHLAGIETRRGFLQEVHRCRPFHQTLLSDLCLPCPANVTLHITYVTHAQIQYAHFSLADKTELNEN